MFTLRSRTTKDAQDRPIDDTDEIRERWRGYTESLYTKDQTIQAEWLTIPSIVVDPVPAVLPVGIPKYLVECLNDLYQNQTAEVETVLYNTLFSREENFAKSEFEIFSREDIFANILFTRKYLPAKISSRENILSRKYLPAKISSRENRLPVSSS